MYTLETLKKELGQYGGDRDEFIFDLLAMDKKNEINLYDEIERLYIKLFELYEDRKDGEGQLLRNGIVSLRDSFLKEHSNIVSNHYDGEDSEEAYSSWCAKRNERLSDLYATRLMLDLLHPIALGLDLEGYRK